MRRQRQLVVTADDGGLSDGVNAAIERAVTSGIVTRVSAMATGAALDDLVARIAGAVPLGLHLDLTEGAAVSGPVPGATDPQGRFRGWPRLVAAALARRLDLEAVARELDAQLDRLGAVGQRATHADGHHHVHVVPGVAELVLGRCRERGIGAVRTPWEPPWTRPLAGPGVLGRRLALAPFAARFGARARARGLSTCDRMAGLGLYRSSDPRAVLGVLVDTLPAGATELVVHPRPGAAGSAETDALCDPAWPERLAARGITLGATGALRRDAPPRATAGEDRPDRHRG